VSGPAATAREVPQDLLIQVRGLRKYFPIRGGVTSRTVGFVRAVDGVDLDIRRGKSMGLIGESGCGKTTVGRCILQLIAPTEGTVAFGGSQISDRRRARPLTLAATLLGVAAAVQAFGIILIAAAWQTYLGLPYLPAMLGVSQEVALVMSLVAVVAAAAAGAGAADQERLGRTLQMGALATLMGSPLAGAGTVVVLAARREFSKETVRSLRKDMQIVFQDPFGSLNPRMLVRNIVGEPLQAFRYDVQARYPDAETARGRATNAAIEKITADLMARVGLNPEHLNRFPHEFSGGQRQRICVARALALKPSFLVLDEPTSALDVSVQAQILNLLKDLQRERRLTYLFISHHLSVIRHMCDDVAVMYLGQIVEQAPNAPLFASPGHPYTLALLSAIPAVDPAERRERIVLEGDVPSPANPPSGCRFHTRCMFSLERETQEVALTATEGGKQYLVDDPRAAARTVRLVVGDRVLDPTGSVEFEVEERPQKGLALKVFMEVPPGASVRARYQRYRSQCAFDEPALVEVAPSHRVACHFHGEVEAAVAEAASTGRPVGEVIHRVRAPLPVAAGEA
jgi:peptide/nickel transport system ATP-binding protein